MKEPYEKGVANHSAPSFAPGIARCMVKRKQGHSRAGYRASKNLVCALSTGRSCGFTVSHSNLGNPLAKVPARHQACVFYEVFLGGSI
jgi:hypothetical protein